EPVDNTTHNNAQPLVQQRLSAPPARYVDKRRQSQRLFAALGIQPPPPPPPLPRHMLARDSLDRVDRNLGLFGSPSLALARPTPLQSSAVAAEEPADVHTADIGRFDKPTSFYENLIHDISMDDIPDKSVLSSDYDNYFGFVDNTILADVYSEQFFTLASQATGFAPYDV